MGRGRARYFERSRGKRSARHRPRLTSVRRPCQHTGTITHRGQGISRPRPPHPMPVPCARSSEAGPHAENATVSIAEFRDSGRGYLAWLAAHGDGYVINIGRSGRGHARLHRAACGTITSRSPFTGPYIKICSASLANLISGRCSGLAWLSGAAEHASRSRCKPGCGRPREPGRALLAGDGPRLSRAGNGGRVRPGLGDPGAGRRAGRGVAVGPPLHPVRPAQRRSARGSRSAPTRRVGDDGRDREILDASYAGFKPANMDAENLVLYNIDAAAERLLPAGCPARSAVRAVIRAAPRAAVGPAVHVLLPVPAGQPRRRDELLAGGPPASRVHEGRRWAGSGPPGGWNRRGWPSTAPRPRSRTER